MIMPIIILRTLTFALLFSSSYVIYTLVKQAMLHAERQRADDYEMKYAKAQESNEERLRKLEESERRVHKLQDSLNR